MNRDEIREILKTEYRKCRKNKKYLVSHYGKDPKKWPAWLK